DPAGNTEPTATLTVKIDATPPTTTATPSGPAGSNGWYKGPVTVVLAAADATSGVASTQYSLNTGQTWTTGTSVALNADGTYSLLYRSTDKAGNVEAAKSLALKIDQTAPTTTAVLSGPTGTGGV